jgi:hypothetical protein
MEINEDPAAVVETMKRAAAALRDAQVRFALAGGMATWARGGVKGGHDCDFIIRPTDVDAAARALEDVGMKTERPPEGWLIKAYDGNDAMVDLIFAPADTDVDDAMLDRATELVVQAVRMPVMSATDILATKLLSLTEQSLDYGPMLNLARTLREQIDWADLRSATDHSPFAAGFFTIAEGLDIVPPAPE